MVKKIRVVEEERTEEELSTEEFQAKMLEYMHTMDWKLWEMLKLIQKAVGEDKQPDSEEVTEDVVKPKARKKTTGPKPVIVDEDD